MTEETMTIEEILKSGLYPKDDGNKEQYHPAGDFALMGEYVLHNRLYCGLTMRVMASLLSLKPIEYSPYESSKKPMRYDFALKAICIFSMKVSFTEKEMAAILKLHRVTEMRFDIPHAIIDYESSVRTIKDFIMANEEFSADKKTELFSRLAEYGPLLEKAIRDEKEREGATAVAATEDAFQTVEKDKYRSAENFELMGKYITGNRLMCFSFSLMEFSLILGLTPGTVSRYASNDMPTEWNLMLKVLCVFSLSDRLDGKEIASVIRLQRNTENRFGIAPVKMNYEHSAQTIRKFITGNPRFSENDKIDLARQLAKYGPLLEKAINEEIIK